MGEGQTSGDVTGVGSKATPEVIQTWVEVFKLYQECSGERRERLQQVADRLGVTFKVARRRLRNYEAMKKGGGAAAASVAATAAAPSPGVAHRAASGGGGGSEASEGAIQDQQLICADCGKEFTWSAGEQEFFREKGFTDRPKRCKECRQSRRDRRVDSTSKRGGR